MKNHHSFKGSASASLYFTGCIWVILFFCVLIPGKTYAQEEAAYEEIYITMNSRIMGNAEIPAVIYNNKAYLPVNDFFDFLKIKNEFSSQYDSLTGFLINSADIFSINRVAGTIRYKDSLVQLKSTDLFYLNDDIYLQTDYFGSVFGLDCKFNFRSLSVKFDTKIELPFIRIQKQEEMRKNLSKLKGEIIADTSIKRDFPLLKLGVMDWDIANSQARGTNNAMVKIGLGGMIAGGETQLYINYNQQQQFSMANQNFLWRYVNNDWKGIKQFSAGRVMPGNSFSLYRPLLGIQLNNSPTTHKKSFGTYLVSNSTEPGWMVELYVNDVLVDYTKADASGLFSFEVPLVYGNCNIKYRYYGPWGEQSFSEQQLIIPFTFLPQKKFEYNITAGKLQDEKNEYYSRVQLNYGLNNRITIGAGTEYNSIAEGKAGLPFMNASARIGNAAIFFGEFVPGVVSKVNLNYRFKTRLQLDVDYTKYQPSQKIIFTNALQVSKISLSAPVSTKFFNGFGRILINNTVLPKGKISQEEIMLGGTIRKISANLSVIRIKNNVLNTFSKASFNIQLPHGIRFSPQLQYQHEQKRIALWKAEAEKRIFGSCVVNIGYENNKLLGIKGFNMGVRQIFSFAQVNATARQVSRADVLFTQNANGGLIFDKEIKNTEARAQRNVGRGGLLIIPFLDYNNNGKQDKNEPLAKGLNVQVKGAQVESKINDPVTRVSGMEAYSRYYLMIDDKNFEDPTWQIKSKVIALVAQPNIFRRIEIPITVAGEVNGYVYLKNLKGKESLARVKVNIYNSSNELVAKVLTEDDGYFSFLGLIPGSYTAMVDPEQLMKIKLKSATDPVSFIIKQSKEGDIADNLEIVLAEN